jgi:GT2 family glycosyltransferase
MLISVVVPTRDRPEDIQKLFASLLQQTRLPDQLIVVDQSTGGESHALAKDSMGAQLWGRCTYVHNSSIRGVSAARNAGIGAADGDVVVFLDDDVVLTADCLEEMESAFVANPDYAGIGGVELQMEHTALSYILYYDIFFVGPFRDRKYRISRNWRRLQGIQPVTGLKTCLAGFRREFLAQHRFDERWRSALLEDIDLCWEVRGGEKKEKFGIWPRTSVWHNFSEARSVGGARYQAAAAAWIFFMRKHVLTNWTLMPAFAWLSVGLLVNAGRRSMTSRSIAPLAGLIRGWRSLFDASLALPYIDMSADPGPSPAIDPGSGEPGCAACLRAASAARTATE